jgi:hypothetical protein
MVRKILGLVAPATLVVGLLGCGKTESTPTAETTAAKSNYVVETEPAGAVPVGEARKNSKDQEDVVLVGRIGGSEKPFVDGVAAFTIVDPQVKYCADEEGCPTPWDYCCNQDEVKDNIAMVKVVDASGKPVAEDARKLLGVKELAMIVVHGKALRDPEGNLSVLADKVFVKN